MVRPGACEKCSGYWLTYDRDLRGVTLGESEEFMAEVRRCRYCGAYWEVGAFSPPQVISHTHARRELPDLDALERATGVNFPDPPPIPEGGV